VSTLTLVAPEAVLPRVQDQLLADLDPAEINSLTDTDLGIWATPEDQTYVDGTYSTVNYGPCLTHVQ
jgi:hypothetical protein